MRPGLLQPLMRPLLQPILLPGRQAIATAGAKSYNEINLLADTFDPRITFTRASTKSYYDNAGALQSAATNIDPLEYDPVTHAVLGRSFWEGRTNLVLNSATLVTQGVTTTATTYTLSFTGTGTVTLSGTSTGSLVGTGANVRVTKTFTATAGTLTLTVAGSVTLAQCEAGAMASPYIATTGATGTRAVDSASVNTLSTVGLSATSGTLYAEADMPAATTLSTGINTVVALSNNTNTNCVTMTLVPAGVMRLRVVTAGAQVAALDLPAVSYGSRIKVAFTYANNAYAVCLNGGTVLTTASGALPTVSQLDIGRTGGTTTRQWDAPIRVIRCFGRVLSAAELQTLTR